MIDCRSTNLPPQYVARGTASSRPSTLAVISSSSCRLGSRRRRGSPRSLPALAALQRARSHSGTCRRTCPCSSGPGTAWRWPMVIRRRSRWPTRWLRPTTRMEWQSFLSGCMALAYRPREAFGARLPEVPLAEIRSDTGARRRAAEPDEAPKSGTGSGYAAAAPRALKEGVNHGEAPEARGDGPRRDCDQEGMHDLGPDPRRALDGRGLRIDSRLRDRATPALAARGGGADGSPRSCGVRERGVALRPAQRVGHCLALDLRRGDPRRVSGPTAEASRRPLQRGAGHRIRA